jgi:hypothetical protein
MMKGRVLLLRDWINAAGLLLILLVTACATPPAPQVTAPPSGQARIWFYRLWDPSESLNTANIDVNGLYVGSVEPGGAFYRDVAPGVYQITPQNRYLDVNQNTNVAVVPGEQVFIAVLDLSSWATAVSGAQWYVRRDARYARLVPPQYAQRRRGGSASHPILQHERGRAADRTRNDQQRQNVDRRYGGGDDAPRVWSKSTVCVLIAEHVDTPDQRLDYAPAELLSVRRSRRRSNGGSPCLMNFKLQRHSAVGLHRLIGMLE